ncbi:aldo/keto reductase [Alicyclobacillus fastidiosus]|uniref:Aldo/keto reductase n=1 Tax=Alicyclobacillus fastidiosus TaxID=392011 RepID=A0ABV5AD99_9BACL|nr:aldo/keto reductase [Alicyclobacillus fastidiosus]WEH08761.1 aldo/keto reductase [Alicyclobacillus fastidiosus]
MKYNRLGHSGLAVSELGLGTNSFGGRADEETSVRILNEAMEHGINFIDTANVYTNTQSESIIGRALAGGKRQQVILATKVGMPRGEHPNQGGSSRREIMEQIDGSLSRLKTDYVDLYQIHTLDKSTPIEETLRALDDLVTAGKVRYIGASNYMAWELMKALSISERERLNRYVSIQPCYSLADRTVEVELEPLCLEEGVGIIPYFPLAGGILTGKYAGGQAPAGSRMEKEPRFKERLDQERLALGNAVQSLATELGTTASALSLSWLMHRRSVSTVIVGASRPEQVLANLQSTELELSADTLERLDALSEPFKYARPFAVFRPLA